MTDYVISDLHFCHENIIKYSRRPYNTVKQMDQALIKNWNNTVKPADTVLFLGDLTLKPEKFNEYLKKLNGAKRLIKGNHDLWTNQTRGRPVMIEEEIKGVHLLFIHNPDQAPEGFDGWIIHGHYHDHGPHIDRSKRRINVCCEHTNYRPISLNKILKMIKNGGDRDEP